MLLVEDNQELREFLRCIFSPMYRVTKRSEALKYLPKYYYLDLMPDGIEMTMNCVRI